MKAENDFIVLGGNGPEDKIPHYRQTIPVNIYHYYIVGEITDPSRYLDLINTLKTSEEHDSIIIGLNSCGGNLDTTVQILAAMAQCAGTVITALEGEACSAASILFLSGDKQIVNPHSTLMIHNYSCGLEGKGNDVAARVTYTQRYFKKLSHEIYKDFLSEDEIEKMLAGQDIWLDSDEVLERLERMEKIADSIPDAVEEAVEEVIEANIKPVKRKSGKA